MANQNSTAAKLVILANIGGIEIPAPGIQSNACDGLLKCPVISGQKYQFAYKLNLSKAYPNVSMGVCSVYIRNNNNNDNCYYYTIINIIIIYTNNTDDDDVQ